jgi:hypothetical protein
VLRKIRERIDLQLVLAEPERARFRDSEGGADDTDINVGQIGGIGVAGQGSSPSTSAVAEQITGACVKSDRTKPSRLLPLRSSAVRRGLYEASKDRTPEWRGTSNSPGSFSTPA